MSYLKEELHSVLANNQEFINTKIAAQEGITSFINDIFKKADDGINFLVGNSSFFEDKSWLEFWRLRDHAVSFDTVAKLTVPSVVGLNGRMLSLIDKLIEASGSFADIEKGVYGKINAWMAEVIEDVSVSHKIWQGAPAVFDLDSLRNNLAKNIGAYATSSNLNAHTDKFEKLYPSMPEYRTCVSKITVLRNAYREIDIDAIIKAEKRCAQLADKLVAKGLLDQMNLKARTNLILLLRNTAERTELLSACFYVAKMAVSSVRATNITLADYKD